MGSDSFVDNKLLCGVTHDLKEELFHFSHHKPWQSGLYSKLVVKQTIFAPFLSPWTLARR
jgi:hypothetical protein